jgi:hypothetical protein
MRRMRRLFLATCWLPAALWIAALAYLQRLGGWGAAGAAAALIVPVILLGAGMSLWGLVLWARALRRGERDQALLIAAFLAGAPVFFYLMRGPR